MQHLFAFTGRAWDPDSGLYYYRARWYDPAVARFLSEDPLGFGAGDTNLTRYVFNNPTHFTDPSGEFIFTAAILVGVAVGGLAYAEDSYNAAAAMNEKAPSKWTQADHARYASLVSTASTVHSVSETVGMVGIGVATGGVGAGLIGGSGVAAGVAGGMAGDAGMQAVSMLLGDQSGWNVGRTLTAGAAGGVAARIGGAAAAYGRRIGVSKMGGWRAALYKGGTGFGTGVAADLAYQGVGLALGSQSSYSFSQTMLAGALGAGLNQFTRMCFTEETRLLTSREGYKGINELKVGDKLLAVGEHDPEGTLEEKEILAVFVGYDYVMEIHVGGRVIRSTRKHPIWARGKGWTAANQLQPGDEVLSHDKRWTKIDKIVDNGEEAKVYNVCVADHHTYFVGGDDWGFDVWAHNASRGPKTDNRFGHNRTIRKVAREVTAKGETVIAGGRKFDGIYRKEAVFDTYGGFRNSRRPDLLVQRADGSIYGINVGKTEASGAPVLRERLAIQDLNEQAGLEMQFVRFGR